MQPRTWLTVVIDTLVKVGRFAIYIWKMIHNMQLNVTANLPENKYQTQNNSQFHKEKISWNFIVFLRILSQLRFQYSGLKKTYFGIIMNRVLKYKTKITQETDTDESENILFIILESCRGKATWNMSESVSSKKIGIPFMRMGIHRNHMRRVFP